MVIIGGGDELISNEYIENVILSMYEEPTNTGQIHNVLSGRSTPSILYLVEIRKWQNLYGSIPKVSRGYIEKLHKKFLHQKLIYRDEKKYLIDDTVLIELNSYFKNNLLLSHTPSLMNADIRNEFWNLVRFISQVVSEKQYKNNKYIPLNDELTAQLFIKNMLHNNKNFEENWIKEQQHIFNTLDEEVAELLVNILSGHETNGLTLSQLSRHKNISKSEVYFMKYETIRIYIQFIQDNSLKMHQIVLNFLLTKMNFGLTTSAIGTYQLLQEGKSIQNISAIKSVKSSTIKEHILEIAFKLPHIDLTFLIPKEIQLELTHYFANHHSWQYKEAANRIENLEFYHYRLIELELIRNGR